MIEHIRKAVEAASAASPSMLSADGKYYVMPAHPNSLYGKAIRHLKEAGAEALSDEECAIIQFGRPDLFE